MTELKALAGADAEFVLEQLERKATLFEAMSALNMRLAGRVADAESKLAKPAFGDAFAAAQASGMSASDSFRQAIAETHPSEHRDLQDPASVAEFRRRFGELVAAGVPATEAARRVWRANPHLANAAVSSHAEKCRRLSK
jgi:hypothetical protein